MKTNHILFGLACVLALLSACAPQKSEVDRVFGSALKEGGSTPYPVAGVTNMEIRAFEQVQQVDDMIVVKITYGAKNGRDLVETKKYRLVAGRLTAVDRSDIRRHIESNLNEINGEAVMFGPQKSAGEQLTWSELVAAIGEEHAKKWGPEASVAGEDYSQVKFKVREYGRIDVALSANGEDYAYVDAR